ncbi:hypothetical protein [Stenotrophomonas sp. NA06056]|uniref:hypothetical protein n=1 Tax=Stenotrophomonas sp. NA06056 TaxID=2742129 RepID=UPI00158AE702|nr:hypothetical protein [Stenotrophomonas sp. NA06056]QKW56795.1 hypothetical protein HUT07_09260 [Stenotrophomonas sp. NA06056]
MIKARHRRLSLVGQGEAKAISVTAKRFQKVRSGEVSAARFIISIACFSGIRMPLETDRIYAGPLKEVIPVHSRLGSCTGVAYRC